MDNNNIEIHIATKSDIKIQAIQTAFKNMLGINYYKLKYFFL